MEFSKFGASREMTAAFYLTLLPSDRFSSAADTAKRGAFETIHQNIPSSWSKLSQNVSLKGYCITSSAWKWVMQITLIVSKINRAMCFAHPSEL